MKKSALNKEKSFFEKIEDNVIESVQTEEKKMANPVKKILSKRPVKIAIAIIILLVILGGGYYQYQKQNIAAGTGGKLSSKEIQNLLEEVGSKIELPKGETPTIATVTDVTKLENQPFFKNAKNGDKVIIYGSTKQAILYRQSIHKIIDVAPINAMPEANPVATSQTVQATPGVSVTPTPTKEVVKLKVVVLNSTKEVGLAKKGADLLDSTIADVIKTSNAVGEYKTTTISKVSKGKTISDSDLKSLVSVYSKVKVSISSLPNGETAPDGADVVIILGSDFSQSY